MRYSTAEPPDVPDKMTHLAFLHGMSAVIPLILQTPLSENADEWFCFLVGCRVGEADIRAECGQLRPLVQMIAPKKNNKI